MRRPNQGVLGAGCMVDALPGSVLLPHWGQAGLGRGWQPRLYEGGRLSLTSLQWREGLV